MIRISTLARLAEDTIINAAGAVADKTKQISHGVRIEYRARQINALERAVRKDEERMAAMSAAERRAHAADQREIVRRAKELSKKRKTK